MVKVSIIVPVYNVEPYLDKCLISLVNQTLKDIEIIVVNDGSPDNSQKIIDKYASKYPNIIKSYIKENGGLSDARNYGLKYAKGEYVGFVDSDDYVEYEMYEKMYNKAISEKFDVVICDVKAISNNHTSYIKSLVNEDIFTADRIKQQMLNIYPTAWNKIYKKDLFDRGINFKKNVWYEDVEFLYRLFPYINSIGTVHEALINYVEREGAITKTFDKRLYNYIDNWNGILEFYKQNQFYNEFYYELEYCYVRYLYATFIMNATSFNKREYNIAVKTAEENVHQHFPKYRKNKYFYKNLKGLYMVTLCFVSKNLLYYLKKITRKIL